MLVILCKKGTSKNEVEKNDKLEKLGCWGLKKFEQDLVIALGFWITATNSMHILS